VEAEVVRPFESPEGALRERRLHGFAPGEAQRAEVSWKDGKRTLAAVAGNKWADAGSASPETADTGLTLFMERLGQLIPSEYPEVAMDSSLESVLSVQYKGKDGKVIGQLELYRRAAPPQPILPAPPAGEAPPAEWFVKTDRTRVLAKVNPMAASRVEQDLKNLQSQPKK
jgi:hypothetical protein